MKLKNSSSSPPYMPIACALHDEYEIAIMHKKRLHLKWKDAAGKRYEESVLAIDIEVKQGEEHLLVKFIHSDICQRIRLDRIIDWSY